MNYVTQITVIRNSELKFISMILPDFQIFTLIEKQHSTIFVHSNLKCPFRMFLSRSSLLIVTLPSTNKGLQNMHSAFKAWLRGHYELQLDYYLCE